MVYEQGKGVHQGTVRKRSCISGKGVCYHWWPLAFTLAKASGVARIVVLLVIPFFERREIQERSCSWSIMVLYSFFESISLRNSCKFRRYGNLEPQEAKGQQVINKAREKGVSVESDSKSSLLC